MGPFEGVEVIGSGGFGEVWRALHVATGTPVALKLLRVSDDAHRQQLAHEVRAAAALTHPGIVALLDADLDGELPWIAMELGSGTLRGERLSGWLEARGFLDGVLEALAHAHARGVLHRDLKPSNLVRVGDRYKLADFGIARAAGDEVDLAGSSGTPHYMAPEQIVGDPRAQGPETDLYALGCLGWELATGRTPFHGRDPLSSHLVETPPEFVPTVEVPPGLEGWLRRLLRKSPTARFRSAADARWALWRLEGGGGGAWAAAPSSGMSTRTATAWGADPVPTGGIDSGEAFTSAADRAPLPSDWREGTSEESAPHLASGGVGIFGRRATALVGRLAERDALWSALLESQHAPRLVALRGQAGAGKSRLARWLVERAAERGAATWRATHADPPDGAEGVRGMLLRALRASGADAATVRQRVLATLPAEVEADADWVDGLVAVAAPPDAPELRFTGPRHRHAVVARLIASVGAPAVVWLDDVQWGADALGLARVLLEDGVPVLVVATLRDDLAARVALPPGAVELGVGPLDDAERGELIRELLDLDPAVVARVAERSAGNPLFAAQIVADWVARGVLEPTPGGLRPRAGAALEVPASASAAWRSRVEHLFTEQDRVALEIAATLGESVSTDEWRAAAGALPDVAALLREHVFIGSDGLRFAHGMIREALLARAEEGGRLVAHHDRCADVVDPRAVDRRGRHLLGAGRWSEAADALGSAAWRAGLQMRLDQSLSLHEDLAVALAHLPEDDVRQARGRVRQAAQLQIAGHRHPAEQLVREAMALATRHDWPELSVDAATNLAANVARTARHAETWPLLELADRAADTLASRAERGVADAAVATKARQRVAMVRAIGLLAEGRPDEAVACIELAAACVDPLVRGAAYQLRGRYHLGRGELDEATAALREAVTAFREGHDSDGQGRAFGDLAVMDHLRGRHDEAIAGYRRAIATLGGDGHGAVVSPQLNLGCLLLLRGDGDEARRCARRALPHLVDVDVATRAYGLMLAWASGFAPDALPEAEALVVATGLDGDYLAMAEVVRAEAEPSRVAEATAFLARWRGGDAHG